MSGPFKPTNEKSASWTEIVMLFLALGTSMYQINTTASSWFKLVPVSLTIVSVILLAKFIGMHIYIREWYRRKSKSRLQEHIAKANYNKFISLLEKMENIRDITDQLQNLEWQDKNDYRYTSYSNNVIYINWLHDIVNAAKSSSTRSFVELSLHGYRFRDFINAFENYYLKLYSDVLGDGRAKYRSEQFMKMTKKAKDRYDHAIQEYNDFSKTLEKNAQASILATIYSSSVDLDYAQAFNKIL